MQPVQRTRADALPCGDAMRFRRCLARVFRFLALRRLREAQGGLGHVVQFIAESSYRE
jgi:hypothetical protein